MPTDAFMLSAICGELDKTLCGGKINKITQPEPDEIMLLIYTKTGLTRLLLSACANYPRIHLTFAPAENPPVPYRFCMLLRKYLAGGEILSVKCAEYDRIITIEISNSTELKDMTVKKLILEIMGRQSNIILCDENNTVISLLKTASLDTLSKRKLFAGLKYVPPENDKIKINDSDKVLVKLREFGGGSLETFIAGSFMGLSKITAAHLVYAANTEGNIGGENAQKIAAAFKEYDSRIKSGNLRPCVLSEGGVPADYFVFPYFDGSGTYSFYNTCSECADAYFLMKDKGKRLSQKKKSLQSSLNNAVLKAEKKYALLTAKLAECENMEQARQYGELLTAYLYRLKGGEKEITVTNYFDGEGKDITIPLDENLTPAKNAQKYFKRYDKLKRAKNAAKEQLGETEKQLDYLNSVSGFLSRSENLSDIDEISAELSQNGIIKHSAATPKKKGKEPNIIATEIEGCKLYCGKNNIQNEYITFKLAKPRDLWFHIKGYHGSHVVLSGTKYTEKSIYTAAKMAAAMSGVKNSDKAAVDYTFKKFVKKPSGAKPGFVTYTDYKTILVNPLQ